MNALDLACGSGRHAKWLAEHGWTVTAVDREPGEMRPGVTTIKADLEKHEFRIEPEAWELIICWLYWQEDLLPEIARGVKPGGFVALAGKTTGRFATSLDRYHAAFPGWEEVASGQDESRAFLIAERPLEKFVNQIADVPGFFGLVDSGPELSASADAMREVCRELFHLAK